MSSLIKKCLILFLLVVMSGLSLLPVAAIHAQSANEPQLAVSVGFDSYAQTNAWTPVFITASNDGDDVLGASLRLSNESIAGAPVVYVRPIDLPSGSRKQVTMYIAEVNALGSGVEVELLSRSGRVITSQRSDVAVIQPTTLLIGFWSDQPSALASLEQIVPSSGETRVALLTSNGLPDTPEGWSALDVLAVYAADTGQLSQGQLDALRGWLTAGGRLIIVGGVDYQRTVAGLAELSPVQASNTANVNLEPLAQFTDAEFSAQLTSLEAPVAVGSLTDDARVMVASDNVPLLAWHPVGEGRVDFLAADPSLAPLSGWQGMLSLWAAILSDASAKPGWSYGFARQYESARQAVSNVPGVSLPSVLQLCGFLGLYVLLIGPVNYLILRRMKRTELAWFTIPVLIVVFSAVAYITGFQLRGSRAILHRLALVQTWPDAEQADVNGLLGVWSPRRTRYDIQLQDGFLARPMPRDLGGALTSVGESRIEQSESIVLRDVQIDVASIQPFLVEGISMNAPTFNGDLILSAAGDGIRIRGEVINDSDIDLADVSLLLSGSVVPVSDLPAGEILQVDEILAGGTSSRQPASNLDPFPDTEGMPYYGVYAYGSPIIGEVAGGRCSDSGDLQRRCNLFAAMLNTESFSSGVYLSGWSDEVPIQMTVLNAGADYVDTTLYIAQLSISLEGSVQGSVDVPPGLTTWRLIESQDQVSRVSPYDMYLYPDEEYVFRFEPIALLPPMHITAFTVHLEQNYGTEPAPSVEVFNVEAEAWVPLPIDYGDNLISDAARFITPSGAVTLRIGGTESDFNTSISRFDVTMHGIVNVDSQE